MTEAKRVLVVSRHPYPIGTTLRRNLTQLVTWGLNVDVVCLTSGFRWASHVADQPGLRLYGIPIKARRTHAFWYALHYLAFFLWALFVVSLLGLLRRYDVIEVENTPDFLVFTTVLARMRRPRIVLFSMELMPELTAARLRLDPQALPVRLATSLERASIAWVDYVVTVSEPCRRILLGRGLPSDKVTVVPNSHPVAGLESARPSQPPFLIIQTTLIERYGVHIAIQAMARLTSEWPGLTLRILGQGESEPQLVELTNLLGLQDRVVFSHGFLAWRPMIEQVRKATIGLVPMLADGYGDLCLPNKVLEFAALGIPIVCSRLPAIAEHFPEECLAYFEPGDAAGLAAQVQRLLADPSAAGRQASLARAVMDGLAWESVSSRYRDALGLSLANRSDLSQRDQLRLPDGARREEASQPSGADSRHDRRAAFRSTSAEGRDACR
jgi:glycosyltransferase involved in cell wall biosynthesis